MAEEGGKDADGVLSLRRQKGIERGGQQFFGQAGCYLWEGCRGRKDGRVLSLERQKGIGRGGRRSFWQAGRYLWEER